MKKRSDRLKLVKEMPLLAQIDHRHLLDNSGKLPWHKDMSRNDRRVINRESKRIATQYRNIINNLYSSGVGYPVDQLTRQMAAEYTNRYASAGVGSMPSSFSFFEPFCQLKRIQKSIAPYMCLLPEMNHLFHMPDFLDFYTSCDISDLGVSTLRRLPEDRIYNFSNNGVLDEISFSDAVGRDFLVSGFSMVRRAASIHWFMIAGEKLTEEQWELRQKASADIDVESLLPYKRAFLRECIERSGSNVGAPLALEGTKTAIRTIVAGEFDVLTAKHIGRAILEETENVYSVHSDEPEHLMVISDSERRESIAETARMRLKEAAVLWNLAESLFQLPPYFEARVTVNREMAGNAASVGGLKGSGGRGLKARYEAVEAVTVDRAASPPSIRRVEMPHYSTETDGYWRRLQPGGIGTDRQGNRIEGRTWVRHPNSRKDNLFDKNVVYVKDLVALAKIKANNLYNAQESGDAILTGADVDRGVLYVLRCAAMDGEIYKVGWTSGTAAERAKALSAATGVPSAFVVVESWAHEDPEALETEVHMQLAPYRVSQRREFFQVNFKEIRDIIEHTIDRASQ